MKSLQIVFQDEISRLPHLLQIYQCGDCGGYFGAEAGSGVSCPYCKGDKVMVYERDEHHKFTGSGWEKKEREAQL